MNPDERQRLEAAGWTIGDASDFLGLSPEEAAFIELKLALSKRLKQQRESRRSVRTPRLHAYMATQRLPLAG
jgi:hypothetical protein